MWRLTVTVVLAVVGASAQSSPRNGDELVSSVLTNCAQMDCVKQSVLEYLDNVLAISSGARNAKNLDAAIFKRVARVFKTHEFKIQLPEMFFDQAEIVYNPKTGLDVASSPSESRGMFLKKKLLLPVLLLLKLKLKALMPIFVALIGLKSLKALILSKLAIAIVLGFVIYQYLGKSGMPMPMMSMAPAEPPTPLYGPPGPSSPPPSSYEPGWEPNQGGPYSRIWTSNSNNNNDPQNLAYSAYYPGSVSSSTSRP